MPDENSPPSSDAVVRRGRSPAFIVISLLAFVFLVALGVYETIPVKVDKVIAPDPTAQAIQGLQTSMQQAVDHLMALQQTVSSGQVETKRLFDQVNTLSDKLEILQKSLASAQQAPTSVVSAETESLRPKRELLVATDFGKRLRKPK